jgi:hypothetical protein
MTILEATRKLESSLPADSSFCVRAEVWRYKSGAALRLDYLVDIQWNGVHIQRTASDISEVVGIALDHWRKANTPSAPADVEQISAEVEQVAQVVEYQHV